MKRSTHFRLSDEALAILPRLATYFGLSKTAVLEMLLREAKRRYLAHPPPPDDDADPQTC